jgi:N-acetyl-anhydromuramyl-L-alanine amidase AmpD
MEAPEKGETAEDVARYFANQRPHNPARGDFGSSAHFNIDNNSVVQSVREQDVAWAAPGCNHNGIQLEHAGYARQTFEDWHDEYSQAMLKLSAKLCARLCRNYGIPIRWLSSSDLKAGRRGITSHANVSMAFRRSTHWDPGPAFPFREYVQMVRAARKAQLDKQAPAVKAPLDEAIELLEESAARKRGHRRVVEALRILRRLRKR